VQTEGGVGALELGVNARWFTGDEVYCGQELRRSPGELGLGYGWPGAAVIKLPHEPATSDTPSRTGHDRNYSFRVNGAQLRVDPPRPSRNTAAGARTTSVVLPGPEIRAQCNSPCCAVPCSCLRTTSERSMAPVSKVRR
jgi:hypothetical protein